MKPNLGNPLAALALSAVTLSVFGALQNFGPESTLRKFFEAISERNANGVNRILSVNSESLDTLSPSEAEIIAEISQLAAAQGGYRILRLRRGARASEALVEYDLPDGRTSLATWLLKRPRNRWTVDLVSTASLRSNSPF